MNKRQYKKAIDALGTGMCVEIFNIGVSTKGADSAKINEAINIVWSAMDVPATNSTAPPSHASTPSSRHRSTRPSSSSTQPRPKLENLCNRGRTEARPRLQCKTSVRP